VQPSGVIPFYKVFFCLLIGSEFSKEKSLKSALLKYQST
jgi:hypothetical protein